ncbi:MAG: phosphotransferase [Pyrinomonadaceae bacterium]
MPQTFTDSAKDRLDRYLKDHEIKAEIEQLTPDASTREFYRIRSYPETSIVCIYPEKFDETLPQIDVTNLFLRSGLPVAVIFDTDFELGIVHHEDFGDTILRDVLEASSSGTRETLIGEAISLIARIQNSTANAFELDSIASRLRFDTEKLLWELNFFKTHYFQSLKNETIPKETEANINKEFTDLARELEECATVLTHRDFHAANLMVSGSGELKIIDHQDARIGSAAYDLVSLLLDRITESPEKDWLDSKKRFFLDQRGKLGLPPIAADKFDHEFDLMTVQRCLKAIGTFSNQAGNFGKTHYVQYIEPMFAVVRDACISIGRFPNLRNLIENILDK